MLSYRLKEALGRRELLNEKIDPGWGVQVPLVRRDPFCQAYVNGGVGLASARPCTQPPSGLGVEVRVEAVPGSFPAEAVDQLPH